jgi:hypothetical protein
MDNMDDIKTSDHVFHSLSLRPKIEFEAQTDNEEIILAVRAHPITFIPIILNGVVLFILIFCVNFILPELLNMEQILFFNIFVSVIFIGYLWFNYLSWYFNIGIITNHRVIDVDFRSILYKEVTYTNLNKIEDVTAKGGGFIASVFNFGNVYIQTAGTEVNVEFMNIPRPSFVAKIVNGLLNK